MEGKITLTEGKKVEKLLQLKQEKIQLESDVKENEAFLEAWVQQKEATGLFRKVRSVDSIKKIDMENRSLKHDMENQKLKNAGYSKEFIRNLCFTLLFYAACVGIIIGILALDRLVIAYFENEYLLYGLYLLIHIGVYLLVFRIFRMVESAMGDRYIRIFHQLGYIGSAMIAHFLMLTWFSSLTGLIVTGVGLLFNILFTFVPGYKN